MNMMSCPRLANCLACPLRNPSPSPTNNNSEPTPHAIPNMVRNDRSLCAHKVARDWRMMSSNILIQGVCPQATGQRVGGPGFRSGRGSHVPPVAHLFEIRRGQVESSATRNIPRQLDGLAGERVSRGRQGISGPCAPQTWWRQKQGATHAPSFTTLSPASIHPVLPLNRCSRCPRSSRLRSSCRGPGEVCHGLAISVLIFRIQLRGGIPVYKHRLPVVFGSLVLLTVSTCLAQSTQLNLPRDSQRASVTQRIGITDITITYHRPLVKGRTIWGKVVPYGQVWRAGANENTTIQFADPVHIEGQPLDAGTYGVHMIPAEDQWTVIFSKVSSAWGSFTYKESEDALRVTIKPQAADFQEALAYDIDQPTSESAVVTMRWEKIAVPFKVAVNVNEMVEDSLHKQLRGLSQYTWDGWDDADNYLLAHKVNLDEALRYEDQSIQVEERYDNLMTKSQVLDAMGKKDEAKTLHAKALAIASPVQLHAYAFQLKGEKKDEQAFAVWRKNAKDHPDLWFTHSGMARVYSSQGDFANALKEMKIAEAGAPEPNRPFLEAFIKRLEAKDDINK